MMLLPTLPPPSSLLVFIVCFLNSVTAQNKTTNGTTPATSHNPNLQYISLVPIALIGVAGAIILIVSTTSIVWYCCKQYQKKRRSENLLHEEAVKSNFTSLNKSLMRDGDLVADRIDASTNRTMYDSDEEM